MPSASPLTGRRARWRCCCAPSRQDRCELTRPDPGPGHRRPVPAPPRPRRCAPARGQGVRSHHAAGPRRRLQMAVASVDLLSARLRGDFDSIFDQAGALLRPGDGQTSADAALSSDLKAVALLNLGVSEAWSLRLADSERHLVAGAALARQNRQALPGGGLPRPPGVRLHEPLLRHGQAALRGSHHGGGAARLGGRGGDRPGAGGARQRADLDGPVRPRRTLARPRQERHPGRRRARDPAAGVPDLRNAAGGARPRPPGA